MAKKLDNGSKSTENDFENQYDSTWDDEDDEEQHDRTKVPKQQIHCTHRDLYAAKDMQNYRHMCQVPPCLDPPGPQSIKDAERSEDDEREMFNLRFYQNKIPSRPDDLYIRDFPRYWFRDYKKLENTHSYIQWLFPIQEQGVNHCAHVLTQKEIKFFRKDDELKRRLLKSYRLMLDFYGIKLLDENTGKVGHAENWRERFENLNRKTHNNLRITRILKSLGILGFEHYQAPLVCFFLTETLVRGRLPRVKRSVLDYFMFSVLNRSERKELIRFAFEKFETKEEFVWCPKRIQRRFQKEINARKAGNPETHPSGSESGAPRKTPKARKQKVKRQDQCLVPPSQPLKMKKNTSCCCML
ncbi:opioid growth factor receptor-like [Pygocentrus nattereri]|uniref:Opioid growth factor receptor (OGFr) conserved domain-containing protein n=1 Tax=Pygocentrus nattereri TaxID=42514 RepID=A0AAR2L668_PYGNA|nr:opioid growth factor receptor-like [Pygocentrus nattereri]